MCVLALALQNAIQSATNQMGSKQIACLCVRVVRMAPQETTNDRSRQIYVQCSTEWEREAAQKIVNAMQKAFTAGLLGENWTIKAQRRGGGKLKIWVEAEDESR